METFCFGTFSDKLKNHKLKYNVKLNLVCPKKVLFYYFSSLILQKKVIFLEKGKNILISLDCVNKKKYFSFLRVKFLEINFFKKFNKILIIFYFVF